MKSRIVVLPGDGIGPEVVAEGVRVLRAVEAAGGHEFAIEEAALRGLPLRIVSAASSSSATACRTTATSGVFPMGQCG